MIGAARALIDTRALRHNLDLTRGAAPAARIMAVIKANAYGHGLLEVARALRDADAFAVARLEEAVALRRSGFEHRIVLLEGVLEATQLERAAEERLDLVVHAPEQLELLEGYAGSEGFEVWLKVDTGMNRLGFAPDAFADAWTRLEELPCVGVVRLMTHLANADDRADPKTTEQLRLFRDLTADYPGERSIANSAGILGFADSHADWVRPGIMLFGVSPFQATTGPELGLESVMTLETELISVKPIPRGARVGYGGVWEAARETRLGVAAIGYGDGYPGALPSGTPALVCGERVPLVGRNSMDLITLDLTDLPEAGIGDRVELWGRDLAPEVVAEYAGTIPYELLCGLTQRVKTEYS